MRCILMNKNVPIVELELDDDTATILKVIKSYELDFLPVGIDVKANIPNKKELNEWWFGRSIPASRSGIRAALEQLGVMKLVSDFSWIPFEELRYLKDDIWGIL